MTPTIERDLIDTCDSLEHLKDRLPKLTLEDRIDVAARLRAAAKTIEAIDESVKEEIKKLRKRNAGYVHGTIFKALLSLVPTTRLDQKKVEVEYPDIYNNCLSSGVVQRVTFEPR